MRLPEPYDRYLRLLGFGEPPSGLPGLRQLLSRHLSRVPFENVSKLLLFGRERAGRVTTLPEFLDGIEHRDLGGTCYTSNPYLMQLLLALGYDADLLSADMSTPHIHSCIRVRLDGVPYHVDVGYAAPFREPLRLDDIPHKVFDGDETYVLDRRPTEELAVDVFSNGARVHGYIAHNEPRTVEFFRQTILDSYLPGKTFMSCLRISRYWETGSVHLRDRILSVEACGKVRTTELKNMSELEAAIIGPLEMPRCPINHAVAVLEELKGQSFFAA